MTTWAVRFALVRAARTVDMTALAVGTPRKSVLGLRDEVRAANNTPPGADAAPEGSVDGDAQPLEEQLALVKRALAMLEREKAAWLLERTSYGELSEAHRRNITYFFRPHR